LVARHDSHVPDPYIEMRLCAGIENTGATSSTDMIIDSIYFSNIGLNILEWDFS
jgi:hypothetical protein